MSNIQQLKRELENQLGKKANYETEIAKFVKIYGGKIVFDNIKNEEINVIFPLDSFFDDPVTFAATHIQIEDNKPLLYGIASNEEEIAVPLDELTIDALYELVYWLDLYDQEQNEKFNEKLKKDFEALKNDVKHLNTPFTNYLNQLSLYDFLLFEMIIGAETDAEKIKAIKAGTPQSNFAYVLYLMENY